MRTFSTIITVSHIGYAVALFQSYRRYADISLEVLCVDGEFTATEFPGMHVTSARTLNGEGIGKDNFARYAPQSDALRWSLKPVWLEYLLTHKGYDTAIFIDPDVAFFSDPSFIFDLLHEKAILLSPHWRGMDPAVDEWNFLLNFRDGIYNGGFLGATLKGISALQWLSKACLYRCEISFEKGLFADQKYFDILHSRFRDVEVLRHQGCNIANWNQKECVRVASGSQVLINGTDPVVFIHFTRSTIKGIVQGDDTLLQPYLSDYVRMLRTSYPEFELPDFGPLKQKKPSFWRRLIQSDKPKPS
jgi:hypothetical protein